MGMPSEVHPTAEDPRLERARHRRCSESPRSERSGTRFITASFTRYTHPTHTIEVTITGVEERSLHGGGLCGPQVRGRIEPAPPKEPTTQVGRAPSILDRPSAAATKRPRTPT